MCVSVPEQLLFGCDTDNPRILSSPGLGHPPTRLDPPDLTFTRSEPRRQFANHPPQHHVAASPPPPFLSHDKSPTPLDMG
ncbi:hypothetical protein B0T26DRAFT_403552 [Lasiosphaeria miniovina]|uniref:Uncharacterized protein n=1 Tax=Lasiosphaeria miniovina TaxID=1954250 RepID=A0AA40A4Z0_9PEZI|nr:uncharacterized protein B0T26DRAFT_403552 [Lasiosphaeria miniovina]KAK0709360.1 hypothetical protein B0T26DRAFT_403552 [Lasiosphaeria miniovina]